MIIKWPLNGQFHDSVTDVLTSQNDLREVANDDDDDDDKEVVIIKVRKMISRNQVVLTYF